MGEIFLKIVNMSIAASWLIVAVVLLRILLKKAPKWINCVLWSLVAIRLVCPFFPESNLSLVPNIISDGTIVKQWTDKWISEPYCVYEGNGYASDASNEMNVISDAELISTDNKSLHIIDENGYGEYIPQETIGSTVVPVLSYVWISVTVALLFYAFFSYIKLKKSVAASAKVRDNILVCDEAKSPFILGIFKPVIYIPSSLTVETLESVLTHETAHIKRHDHWWKPLGYLLLTVYWFNPLCWLAYILLCRDIEMACDEKVIRDMDNSAKAAYSQALLNCSFPRKKIAACPLAFGEVGVKERVKFVLNYKKPTFWIIAVAVVTCIVVGVFFMTNPKDNEPDLSFLNYENAISTLADMTDVDAIYYPVTEKNEDGKICLGYVNSNEFAKYLDLASWETWRSPFNSLPSSGSVEICIENDYRITIYQKPKLAKVSYSGEERYYRTHSGDYEEVVALVYSEARAETVDNEAVSTVVPNETPNSSVGDVDEPKNATTNIRTEVCELYLEVLEDLWNVDPGLNGGISQIGIDLSGLTHLTEEEKESVMSDFASRHNLPYIAGTWEELCEQGYIDKDNLYWEDGLFFSIKTTEVNDFILDSTTFDAQKWRSGLGAYFFSQCTARKKLNGKWSYTVGAEMIS